MFLNLCKSNQVNMLRQRVSVSQQRAYNILVAHYSTDRSSDMANEFPKKSMTEDLIARYQQHLNVKALQPLYDSASPRSDLSKVAIVSAGMSGLYSALLLKKYEVDVKIFEATDRVGGRVYTH